MPKRRARYETGGRPSQRTEPPAQADESSVYARGQTVIPKIIREALGIECGTRLHWELREGVIHVIPIPQNPVQALRGMLRGTGVTYEWFMQQRQQERQREREQERLWEEESARQRRPRGSSSTPPQ